MPETNAPSYIIDGALRCATTHPTLICLYMSIIIHPSDAIGEN